MMKRVAMDSSPYGSYGVGKSKTMEKFQNLMQDYEELQKEIEGGLLQKLRAEVERQNTDVESSRNKLENMKQRKATLSAEVRYLRRRYKYLLQSKSMRLPQEQVKEFRQQHDLENQRQKIVKVQIPKKKEPALRHLPPLPRPNNKLRVNTGNEISVQKTIPSFDSQHKGKHHGGKKNVFRFNPTTTSTLNPKGRLYKGKEVATHQTPIPMIDLNKQGNTYNGIGAAMHTPASFFNLPQNEATFSGTQPTFQSRAPVFDLNQRSVEEEEYQDNSEMVRQDQISDLKLSICRNVGEGSNRVGKRKISWQDPVALRV